jgi:hypothetical protein
MSDGKLICELKKSAGEKVVLQFTEFKGKKLIDIRIFYADDDGSWKPTRKGMSLLRELIPELKKAVDLAAAEYKKGLPSPEAKGESQEEKVPF